MSVPISFRQSVTAKSEKYPTQISATDLDKNFNYCNTQFPPANTQGIPQPWVIEEFIGESGDTQQRLFFSPSPPTDGGTYVLGFVGGKFQWIATEAC